MQGFVQQQAQNAPNQAPETGYIIGRTIAERDDITAVFAANDSTALGILRACHEQGRPVPHSLSVVGFDDMSEAQSFWPPLTTIRQQFDDVGRLAIESLFRQMQSSEPEKIAIVPTRLIVRQSTAAPPGSPA